MDEEPHPTLYSSCSPILLLLRILHSVDYIFLSQASSHHRFPASLTSKPSSASLTMTSPKQYHLRITAGPSYDLSTHQIVPVNTSTPLTIDSPHITTNLSIRIASFRGLPSSSPSTSPYFEHDPHEKDRYSIQFDFKLKEESIPGTDLVFGNDFEKRTSAYTCMLRWVDVFQELIQHSDKRQTPHGLRDSLPTSPLGNRSRTRW
jgi:hypothetical protein